MTDDSVNPKLALEMRAYRNARYHEDREAHFRSVNRWLNFAIIILGSAAFATATTTAKIPYVEWHVTSVAAAVTAIIGSLQLVFDLGGQASVHRELRQKFLAIMARAARSDCDTESLNEELVATYGGEPEVYNAVNMLAYNAAQDAFDRKGGKIAVSFWQGVLRHWRRYDAKDFPDLAAV